MEVAFHGKRDGGRVSWKTEGTGVVNKHTHVPCIPQPYKLYPRHGRHPALEEPTAASQRPTSWYTCCPSCRRCKGVESPRKCPPSAGSVASFSSRRRSSIASTSSYASLPNAYAMVATLFAEIKSSAVRDWDEDPLYWDAIM